MKTSTITKAYIQTSRRLELGSWFIIGQKFFVFTWRVINLIVIFTTYIVHVIRQFAGGSSRASSWFGSCRCISGVIDACCCVVVWFQFSGGDCFKVAIWIFFVKFYFTSNKNFKQLQVELNVFNCLKIQNKAFYLIETSVYNIILFKNQWQWLLLQCCHLNLFWNVVMQVIKVNNNK